MTDCERWVNQTHPWASNTQFAASNLIVNIAVGTKSLPSAHKLPFLCMHVLDSFVPYTLQLRGVLLVIFYFYFGSEKHSKEGVCVGGGGGVF